MSKTQAKKAEQKSAKASVLSKRVQLGSGKLGKDVKAPKWLRSFGGYFVGAYKELRQVKWPTRRAAWSLTFAVIVFTALLIAVILALDYAFSALFKQVIL